MTFECEKQNMNLLLIQWWWIRDDLCRKHLMFCGSWELELITYLSYNVYVCLPYSGMSTLLCIAFSCIGSILPGHGSMFYSSRIDKYTDAVLSPRCR